MFLITANYLNSVSHIQLYMIVDSHIMYISNNTEHSIKKELWRAFLLFKQLLYWTKSFGLQKFKLSEMRCIFCSFYCIEFFNAIESWKSVAMHSTFNHWCSGKLKKQKNYYVVLQHFQKMSFLITQYIIRLFILL